MWIIGLILLIYGTKTESFQCPEFCHCVETSVLYNNSHPDLDIIDVMSMDDNSISLDPTVYDRTGLGLSDVVKNRNSKDGTNATAEGRNEEMFSYQITCNGLRDMKSLWFRDLPDPTTQLIIQGASFQSVKTLHLILKQILSKLYNLTDFSIKNSIILSQEPQAGPRQEFLPFASILNPILRSKENKLINETDCRHVQIVNLSNNTITYLPSGLFHSCSNLQTVDLSENLIKNLEDEIFHPLFNLLRLDLHRNRLKSLNEAVFRNLTKLVTLDVSQNKISSVAPSSFQNLVNLNTLILSGNPMSTILVLLGTGKRLRVIDISKTGLRQIPGTLERSVRSLILEGNHLSAIECGDLDSYSLLSYLNLNNNRISYIADDAMGRLELLANLQLSHNKLFQVPKSLPDNLEILNLSFNLIQNISCTDFTNLSLLKELSLSNNQIRRIEENSFINLLQLRTLDLSWNPILFLPPLQGLTKLRVLNLSYFTNVSKDWRHAYKSFPTLSPGSIETLSLESSPTLSQVFLLDTKTLQLYGNLTELHLRFSNLTTLRMDIFSLLPRLRILELEGNPWHCDKEMLVTSMWLRAHASNNGTSSDENEINTMHCATPLHLHRKPLSALRLEDFKETFKAASQPVSNGSEVKLLSNSKSNMSRGNLNREMDKNNSLPVIAVSLRMSTAEALLIKDLNAGETISGSRNAFSEVLNTTEDDTINSTIVKNATEFVNVSKSADSDVSDNDIHISAEIPKTMDSSSEVTTFWDGDSMERNSSFWDETSEKTNVTEFEFDGGRRDTSMSAGGGNGTADAVTLRQVTSSHPSLVVVMFVGVVIAVSFALALHQVAKTRRNRGYRLQSHEMEVHSVSSPANDIW